MLPTVDAMGIAELVKGNMCSLQLFQSSVLKICVDKLVCWVVSWEAEGCEAGNAVPQAGVERRGENGMGDSISSHYSYNCQNLLIRGLWFKCRSILLCCRPGGSLSTSGWLGTVQSVNNVLYCVFSWCWMCRDHWSNFYLAGWCILVEEHMTLLSTG